MKKLLISSLTVASLMLSPLAAYAHTNGHDDHGKDHGYDEHHHDNHDHHHDDHHYDDHHDRHGPPPHHDRVIVVDRGFHHQGPPPRHRYYHRSDLANIATFAVLAGVTYAIIDNVYYRKSGDRYEYISKPPAGSYRVITVR
ncbi:hypothetical protein [Gallaecimonas mangrovi]|uniref:hypothetical protein n=1 Tax=Gallaecimonas mangrovi TaxID=2291597 RepID=UPI000E20968C|nr:hypothetical protein [Gallaecimonas mangrovi]